MSKDVYLSQISGDNSINIGRDMNQHIWTAEAIFAFFFCLYFLKKATTDARIVSANDSADSKRTLMHLSWMRFGIFACLIFVALTCASVGMGFDADSTLRLVLSWACIVLYVVAYSTIFFKNRMNSFLLRHIY